MILSLTIFGLLGFSAQMQAQQNIPSPHKWIAPAFAGVSILGGLGSVLYFGHQHKKLKAPNKPERPKELSNLQFIHENIQNLESIQQLGKDFPSCSYEESRTELSSKFGKLYISEQLGLNYPTYQKKERILGYLRSGVADLLSINEAFNTDKAKRDQSPGSHLKNPALEIADFTDDVLEQQKAKKAALEKQQQDYDQAQRDYSSKDQHYKKQVSKNRTSIGFGLGFLTAGAVTLFYLRKK